MEKVHCFKCSCENKPTFLCQCSEKGCFSCKNHLSEHIEDSSVSHYPKSLYEKPDSDSKNLICKKLVQINESLEDIRWSIIEKTTGFIKNIAERLDKIIEKIDLTRKECTDLLLKIIETEVYNDDEIFKIIRHKPSQALLEFDFLKKEKIILLELDDTLQLGNNFKASLELVASIFKNTENSDIAEKINSYYDKQNTNQNFAAQGKQKYLSHLIDKQSDPDLKLSYVDEEEKAQQNQEQNIFYFKNWTKILISVNLSTMETSEKLVSVPEDMHVNTSMCLLPENSIFCYGNLKLRREKPYSGIAFSIDCNQNVARFPDGYPCIYAGSIYHNREIYIFGGNDGKELDFVRSFSLKENKWIPRGSMLSPSSACSCEYFQGKIYTAGWNHSKIHTFCISSGAHNALDLSLVQRTNKVIFANEGRLYVIESNGVIYESGVNDVFDWMSVGIFEDKGRFSISYKYWWQKNVFFMISDALFKFDFSTKSILKLSNSSK